MTDTNSPTTGWLCRLGLHHYVRRVDDNPEVRGQTLLQCTRCGRPEDGPPWCRRWAPRRPASASADDHARTRQVPALCRYPTIVSPDANIRVNDGQQTSISKTASTWGTVGPAGSM